MNTTTLQERIERLEHVLGTLITWLGGSGLRPDEVTKLIAMLTKEKEP
jgi:hypothetical protein